MPRHLRDFARADADNPYWRRGGVRAPALAAWALGAAAGLLVHHAVLIDAGVPVATAVAATTALLLLA